VVFDLTDYFLRVFRENFHRVVKELRTTQ
jgi:hypothetical protein